MSKWTDEQVAQLKEVYKADSSEAERKAQVAQLATDLGVSEQAVRGKLTAEGIYVAQKRATAEKGTTKDEYAEAIRILFGTDRLSSLNKMSKVDLEHMSQLLIALSEKVNLATK